MNVAPEPAPPVTVARLPTNQLEPPVVIVIPVIPPEPLTEDTVTVAPVPIKGSLW